MPEYHEDPDLEILTARQFLHSVVHVKTDGQHLRWKLIYVDALWSGQPARVWLLSQCLSISLIFRLFQPSICMEYQTIGSDYKSVLLCHAECFHNRLCTIKEGKEKQQISGGLLLCYQDLGR